MSLCQEEGVSGHGEYVASSASGHDTALQHSISVQCDDPQVLQASAAHRNTERLLIGVMPVEVSDLYDIIHRYCSTEAFNFVCVPLVHPFFDRDAGAGSNPSPDDRSTLPFTRSDLVLPSSSTWTACLSGLVSQWIIDDLCSSHRPTQRNAEKAFAQEIGWASHLSLDAVMIPPPPLLTSKPRPSDSASDCWNLALHIATTQTAVPLNYKIILPPFARASQVASHMSSAFIDLGGSSLLESPTPPSSSKQVDPWEVWNLVHSQASFSRRLSVALHFSVDDIKTLEEMQGTCVRTSPEDGIEDISSIFVPHKPKLNANTQIERWLGEPLSAVIISTEAFFFLDQTTIKLPITMQLFLQHAFERGAEIIITGSSNFSTGLSPFREYIEALQTTQRIPLAYHAAFSAPFRDALQIPLQPLADHIQSSTYETFERDPVKYANYKHAIQKALETRHRSDYQVSNRIPIVVVVGAGRGPLVGAVLQASDDAKVPVSVYAIEKNPYAIQTLRQRLVSEWKERNVSIVREDMRKWQPSFKADIIVSELLGSFGDNELSPECLDGAVRFLSPNGISIPESSTSYLAPISASKVWADIKSREPKSLETPFVVQLHQTFVISAPQTCFTFTHKAKESVQEEVCDVSAVADKESDNTRSMLLSFIARETATVHGFVGYFSSLLYGSESLSIAPRSYSQGMFSWFPIFFPLIQPVSVVKGEKIQLSLRRCVGANKVWYEWAMIYPVKTSIHNKNASSYSIGL